jgi:hypothetical protein
VSVYLEPHPFVASLSSVLQSSNKLPGGGVAAGKRYKELETKAEELETKAAARQTEATTRPGGSHVQSESPTGDDEAEKQPAQSLLTGRFPEQQATYTQRSLKAVRRLADANDLPQLVTFTGFVGATFERPGSGTGDWTILYLDSRLWAWLLVETDGIVFRRPVKDDSSPFGSRDVIWVKENATVGRGCDSVSLEAQFLTGEFSLAGDFETPPLSGGTLSAATGVFCEGRSPGCCRKTPG